MKWNRLNTQWDVSYKQWRKINARCGIALKQKHNSLTKCDKCNWFCCIALVKNGKVYKQRPKVLKKQPFRKQSPIHAYGMRPELYPANIGFLSPAGYIKKGFKKPCPFSSNLMSGKGHQFGIKGSHLHLGTIIPVTIPLRVTKAL